MHELARRDGWTTEEDLLLANTILRHIRDGSTQLAAFDEVAGKLSRTSAACGFRWNATVRKQYKNEIHMAKTVKKFSQRPERVNLKPVVTSSETTVNISSIISSLEDFKRRMTELRMENKKLRVELEEKQSKIITLEKELEETQNSNTSPVEDYEALMTILNRARSLGVVFTDEPENRSAFKMDPNGNLERLL